MSGHSLAELTSYIVIRHKKKLLVCAEAEITGFGGHLLIQQVVGTRTFQVFEVPGNQGINPAASPARLRFFAAEVADIPGADAVTLDTATGAVMVEITSPKVEQDR